MIGLRGIVLLVFLLPSLPICLFRPFYGIVLWTIVAFTSLHLYSWGVASMLPVGEAIAIPTLIGFLLFSRNAFTNLASREVLLLVSLWAWFTVTSIVSTNTPLFMHHTIATWTYWGQFSKIALMTLVTIAVVNSFAQLRTLLIVIACCFGFFVAKALPFMILTGGSNRIYGPERSMIADNNDFGLALNMTLPLFFFLAQTESRPWVKRLLWGLSLATVPAILFTYSRGALLGLMAVLGLMCLRLKQRVILIPILVVGMGVGFLLAPDSWKERMNPTRSEALDESALSRINAWKFAVALASDYPVTGGGFGTFTGFLFVRYAPNVRDVHGPHSVYFGVLGEHGFVGLALYLTLVLCCFHSLHWVVKWARFYGDEVALNYGNMLRFALVGYLVSGLFLGRAYFDYYYTLVACIVVLKRVCAQSWSQLEPDEEPVEVEEAV